MNELKLNFLDKFLISCSGASRGTLLNTKSEDEKDNYKLLGVTVLIVAIVASISFFTTMVFIFETSLSTATFGSFIYGFIIFNFEKFIIKPSLKETKIMFVARFFWAILIAFAISMGYEFLLFKDDIKFMEKEIAGKFLDNSKIKEKKEKINTLAEEIEKIKLDSNYVDREVKNYEELKVNKENKLNNKKEEVEKNIAISTLLKVFPYKILSLHLQ